MFTTHKTDAPPRHGDSSVDFSGNGSLSPPTNSDHWTPLCSEDSVRGPMRSPDLDRRPPHSKRNSLLNLRSRSNTATSMSSQASMNSLSHNQYEASRSESPLPIGQLQSETSTSRKSLFRGKLGKRLSESPFNQPNQFETSEFESIGKRTSVLRKAMRRDQQTDVSFREMKHRISSPFDFQHLTHTDREQYATLQKSPEFDLAEDFQAVRASHQPSNRLTGIKANDLHFNNFSSENLSITDIRSKSVADAAPSPRSPTGRQQSEVGSEPASPRPNLRLTRSVESFSQPGVKHRGHGHSQSIIGPPRTSSLSKAYDEGEKISTSARGGLPRRDRTKRESGIWGSLSLASHELEPVGSYFDGSAADVGHALTTPNDLAIQAVTPPFSPGLEDVAEEPEMFTHPRAAPQPPVKTPTSPRSPMFDPNFSMHYSPTSRSRSRGNSHSLSQRNMHSRPASQMSDTLRSSGLIRRESVRRRSPRRRQSNTWRAPQESWEDSVDFIYENALEADCDFEWDRTSIDDSFNEEDSDLKNKQDTDFSSTLRGPRITRADSDAAFPNSAPPFSQDFRASLLVPTSVPDLEPTSATSASTMETALATPSEVYSIPRRASNQSSLSQALLVSHDYKDNRDTYYDDLLNQYDDSDPHFTLLDPEYSNTSSARSSRVRSSRRSSYDSSFMSSAQSSGLWSSPVRRSASSAGSVPDLVPSRRTRRDFSFSLMIDQLSDSVASLKNLDEEKESDNDITPPGRSPDDRTMLPVNDKVEEASHQSEPKALENELRAQLELARRGSQRNDSSPIDNEIKNSFAHAESSAQLPARKSTRQHKQALSDGAAKLLATGPGSQSDLQPKTRSRAATTTVRSPMLSLFPSPPRNSPTPNRM